MAYFLPLIPETPLTMSIKPKTIPCPAKTSKIVFNVVDLEVTKALLVTLIPGAVGLSETEIKPLVLVTLIVLIIASAMAFVPLFRRYPIALLRSAYSEISRFYSPGSEISSPTSLLVFIRIEVNI